ncbi:MAG: phage portal protein [Alphaproteobacteria bacterium]|nr:phage portal protein [Alphaproteobacteria bacterium]
MSLLARAIAAPFKLWNHVTDEIAKERRLTLKDGLGWSRMFGRSSYAGKMVTLDRVLELDTALDCVRKNSQVISSLPLSFYEKGTDGNRVEVDDPVAMVLGQYGSPNVDQTPLEFWESQAAWLQTEGNAYSEKIFNGETLTGLQPLDASKCRPVRETDGRLIYRLIDRGQIDELPRDKVFHIKGFGQALTERDLGLSIISFGSNTFGSAMAADEASGKMVGSGLHSSGVLSSDVTLDTDQRKDLQEIMDEYVGSKKAGKLMILEAGLKYDPLTLNPNDAQLLETRRFDVERICRWFGVPPIIVGHSGEGQTMWGTGVEQIMLRWLTQGIEPILDRIEARIHKQLIRPSGKRRRYAEFNREAMMQMDSKAKAEFLSKMTQNGLMSRNEGRQKINLPNRPGADALTAQINLAPVETLGQQQRNRT